MVDRQSAGIAAQVQGDADALARRFDEAAPFRHLVIDGFLEPGLATALLDQFPAFERGNFLAEHGRPGAKSTVENLRSLGPAFHELDDLVRSPAFLAWLGAITGIAGLRYDPSYLGGGTHENRHGASLDAHIDFNFHPVERWQRRLNLIVYLNPDWPPEWGGALELHRDPSSDPVPAHSLPPLFNRAVLFETSEHSWHGVSPITLPPERRQQGRRSLAFYFYTTPAAEVGAEPAAHSTVYVPRPLPAHLQAGHVLDAADVAALHQLVTDRDGRIAIQYEEIARLMTLARALERGALGSAMYLARRAMATLRRRRPRP